MEPPASERTDSIVGLTCTWRQTIRTYVWRLGPTNQATTMLMPYNPTIGAAKIVWVIGSPVGVMTAATMKIRSSAYLKFLARNRAVTIRIFARKNTTVGI